MKGWERKGDEMLEEKGNGESHSSKITIIMDNRIEESNRTQKFDANRYKR